MEAHLYSNGSVDLEGIVCSVLQSVLVEAAAVALLAQAHSSLLMKRSSPEDGSNASINLTAIEERFPLGYLSKVDKPAPENKDADEEDDEDDEDDGGDMDEDDGSSEEEDSEDDEDDSDAESDGDGESDDDDDDEDDEDDDDDDDDEDDNDEDESDEEGQKEGQVQPPSKRKK